MRLVRDQEERGHFTMVIGGELLTDHAEAIRLAVSLPPASAARLRNSAICDCRLLAPVENARKNLLEVHQPNAARGFPQRQTLEMAVAKLGKIVRVDAERSLMAVGTATEMSW
jgi:hypothetical protein